MEHVSSINRKVAATVKRNKLSGGVWFYIISVLVHLNGPGSILVLATGQDRPNILFLFTDDQRPDTIGALGNPAIKTPTMDTLAEKGFVFRHAYCFGSNSGAVCLPSRNMLLSGRAYFRWEGRYAPADEPNLPASLNRAGYTTYHHGKKGNTARRIHDVFDISKYVEDQPDRMTGEPGQEIVDQAIEFLKQRRDRSPFFMYLAFSNPHDPRIAAPPYRKR